MHKKQIENISRHLCELAIPTWNSGGGKMGKYVLFKGVSHSL